MSTPGYLSIGAGAGASIEPFSASGFAAGIYWPDDPRMGLGMPPSAGDFNDRRVHTAFPGIPGIVRKFYSGSFAQERQRINLDLIIAGTAGNVWGTWEGLKVAWSQPPRFTVTLPDGTAYQGCSLLVPGGAAPRAMFDWIGGLVLLCGSLTFEQLSQTA